MTRTILKVFLLFLLSTLGLYSAEVRALCENISAVREKLLKMNAIDRGPYAFIDHIYVDSQDRDLSKGFFRIREYQLTQWKQKKVQVIHKISGFKMECDTLEEARKWILSGYEEEFSFARQGREYFLEEMRIYVEEIEGMLPSIEIVAANSEVIFDLFKVLGATEIIKRSVPQYLVSSGSFK